MPHRYEELEAIRSDLFEGKAAPSLPIQTFMHWFGAQRRTAQNVHTIERALADYGIRTVPNYLNIWVDTPITFELAPEPPPPPDGDDDDKASSADATGAGEAPAETKSSDDASFRISKIASANRRMLAARGPCHGDNERITAKVASPRKAGAMADRVSRSLFGLGGAHLSDLSKVRCKALQYSRRKVAVAEGPYPQIVLECGKAVCINQEGRIWLEAFSRPGAVMIGTRQLFSSLLFALLTACTTVPTIDGAAKVSINAVAERIKCDIWHVVRRKLDEQPNKFSFLKQWSARAHVTLGVDNTASLNPGATLITPLPASQLFNMGLGAGIQTEAVSTTDTEFFLSFAEMDNELTKDPSLSLYNNCLREDGIRLNSDLKLDDLFDSALEPVATGVLSVGNHAGFGGTAPPALTPAQVKSITDYKNVLFGAISAKVGKAAVAPTLKNDAKTALTHEFNGLTNTQQKFIMEYSNKLDFLIPKKDERGIDIPPPAPDDKKLIVLKNIRDEQAEAAETEKLVHNINDNIVKPVADVIIASFPACATSVNDLKSKTMVGAASVSALKLQLDQTVDPVQAQGFITRVRAVKTLLDKTMKTVMTDLNTCPKMKMAKDTPMYDPIDLISQTINFYITSSGTVSPSWKLTRVSAPLAPAFATASRKDTNTLIIAFGRTDSSKGSATGGGPVANQILTSSLRDVLIAR